MRPWTTHTVTITPARWRVDTSAGAGTPILLLHGIPGWRGTWHAAGALLAQHHPVIVPDLLGFGESGSPPRPMHAAEHAAAILRMLDRLQIEAVHLAGFDFGGPIAVSMVRVAPARIRSLTLLATNVFTDTPIPPPLRIARVRGLGEVAFRLMMGKVGLTMMWFAAVKQRDAFPLNRYRSTLRFHEGLKSTRQVFVNSLRNLESLYRPIEDTLPSISVPTAVIWGDSDPFFPLAVGQRTARMIPGAVFLPIAGCGHFIPEEHPQAVAHAIEQLIHRAEDIVAPPVRDR